MSDAGGATRRAEEPRASHAPPPVGEHLVEVREPGRTALRLLVTGRLAIGRAGDGLLLGDDRLSRQHCELLVTHGALMVTDLDSTNGTFVNERRVQGTVRLGPGDVVRIGDTTLLVGRAATGSAGAWPDPGADGTRTTIVGALAGAAPTGLLPTATAEMDDELRASSVGGTITLVFSDIVDSTVQNARLGDRQWYSVLQRHDEIIRRQIERNAGTEVKGQGDGFMLTFSSARRGVQFSAAVQRDLASLRASDPSFDLHVRIGVHTGEVIRAAGDVFGRHVIVAARVSALGQADEVLVSSLVHELVQPMGDFTFGPPRVVALKGVSDSAVVHPLLWAVP